MPSCTFLPRPPQPHVLIVGGGLAGLATAAALVGQGLHLTVLESRPRLGGRASSFPDPATGELVDNCQHVSMGCCTNLADFCTRTGIRHLFRPEPEVIFVGPDGSWSRLKAGRLPAPFHLTGGLLRAKYLSLPDKLRIIYGMACLRLGRGDRPGEPFADWLLRHGQTKRTMERYWVTVLVSALNERLECMDVGHARKVFLDGFLRNRRGGVMEVPTVPLGELYGTRLESWLRRRGVDVRLKTGVRALAIDAEGSIAGVTLRTGEALGADFVVLAVPFHRIVGLLPEAAQVRMPALEEVKSIAPAPITGVHLWFDRPVFPLDHAAVVGRLVHWVFNHTVLRGRTDPDGGGQYLQVVISASFDLLALDKTAIRDAVLADLTALWPEVNAATLRRWWVVTEHSATFSVRPGIDALRPPQRTPIDGLFLAGDWTATGWPATMEGAVRAGYLAAEGVLSDLDRAQTLLVPDLPSTPLSRLLLGPPAPGRPVVAPSLPSPAPDCRVVSPQREPVRSPGARQGAEVVDRA